MCACLARLHLKPVQKKWGVVLWGFIELGFICLKKVPLTFHKHSPSIHYSVTKDPII